jgi:serine/threonine protein kinase
VALDRQHYHYCVDGEEVMKIERESEQEGGSGIFVWGQLVVDKEPCGQTVGVKVRHKRHQEDKNAHESEMQASVHKKRRHLVPMVLNTFPNGFFMEKLYGEDLANIILGKGGLLGFVQRMGVKEEVQDRLAATRKLRSLLCAAVMDAVQELHEDGFAHNDVKLENLHAVYEGTLEKGCFKVRLLDFEMAQTDDHLINGGTAAYIKPGALGRINTLKEQQDNDIFAVAVVFHAITTGMLPHIGSNYEKKFESETVKTIISHIDTVLTPTDLKTIKQQYE